MCGGGGGGLGGLLSFDKKLYSDPFGSFTKGAPFKKYNPLFPEYPKPPNFKKPPKVIDPTKDIALAQQHAKEAAIGAYSYSDTVLTGGKGLGTTSAKNLWKSLGAS